MNRSERRRLGLKKERTMTVTESQLNDIIAQRLREEMPRVTEEALLTMVYNSIMVIEGHFGELMRKDGRVERYAHLLEFQLECFADRHVTGQDMRDYLKEVYDIEVKLT